jgi:hypothetical protein
MKSILTVWTPRFPPFFLWENAHRIYCYEYISQYQGRHQHNKKSAALQVINLKWTGPKKISGCDNFCLKSPGIADGAASAALI